MPFCRLASALIRAGVDHKAFPAGHTLANAAPQDGLEHSPRQIALARAATRSSGIEERSRLSLWE